MPIGVEDTGHSRGQFSFEDLAPLTFTTLYLRLHKHSFLRTMLALSMLCSNFRWRMIFRHATRTSRDMFFGKTISQPCTIKCYSGLCDFRMTVDHARSVVSPSTTHRLLSYLRRPRTVCCRITVDHAQSVV